MMGGNPMSPAPNKGQELGLAHRHDPIGFCCDTVHFCFFIAGDKGEVLDTVARRFPSLLIKINDVSVSKGISDDRKDVLHLAHFDSVGLIRK